MYHIGSKYLYENKFTTNAPFTVKDDIIGGLKKRKRQANIVIGWDYICKNSRYATSVPRVRQECT